MQYIGDMQGDYEAAFTRAGIDFIHASYGYGKCDHSVKSIKNPKLVVGLMKAGGIRLVSKANWR